MCLCGVLLLFKHVLYFKHLLLVLFQLLDHLPHLISLIAVRTVSRVILVNVIGTLDENKNIKWQSNCVKDDSSNAKTSSKSIDACPSDSCCSSTSTGKATNFKDAPDYIKSCIN